MSPTASLAVFAVAAGLAIIGQMLVLRDGLIGRTPSANVTTGGRLREALWITLPAIALAATLWATWRALPPRTAAASAAGPVATAIHERVR
jgi:hypothetical protein